jgi:hypothetical protein
MDGKGSGSTITTASGATATVAPTVAYVQTVPATTYYYQPYYCPAYAWYPPVSFSFGWGWAAGMVEVARRLATLKNRQWSLCNLSATAQVQAS